MRSSRRFKMRGALNLTAVFGDPVAHSLSPAMHNAAFRHLGLPWRYLKFHVSACLLPQALRGARVLGFRGVNLTIPLKESAVRHMDHLTVQARGMGAVNTVIFDGRRMTGHNTDGEGFLRSVREEWGFRPRGTRIVVLGAGGAARAVVFALAFAGTREIALVNRTHARAFKLAVEARRGSRARITPVALTRRTDWMRLTRGAALLVNATSLGMKGERSPVPARCLPSRLLVSDLVYNPERTALMRTAASRGLRAANGVGMLVHQGALAFEAWTGRRAPIAVMRQALLNALAQSGRGGVKR